MEEVLVLTPGQVDEFGVGAYGYEIGVIGFELVMLICQISEFRRSDECEIRRVEKENRPFLIPLLLREGELPKVPARGLKGLNLEIRHHVPDPQTPAGFHTRLLFTFSNSSILLFTRAVNRLETSGFMI
jgi:hypothetical protein